MSPLNEMTNLIEELRRSIEDPGLRKKHFGDDNDRWSKFCVAMDSLEDSDLAISDFLAGGLGSSDGERYLRLYGILQAVFIQQDAVRALWEIVMDEGFPEMPVDSPWRTIREIRNHAAGHPIEVRRHGITSRTFVTRMALEFGMLSLITDKNTGSNIHWGGELKDTLESYLTEGSQLLRKVLDKVPLKWPDLEV